MALQNYIIVSIRKQNKHNSENHNDTFLENKYVPPP